MGEQTRDKPWIFRTYAGHSTAREVERALSQESEQGADRPLGRLRPADADRLRQRSCAGARGGRQGRRADQPSRRHARIVRGHPARRDEHLDDDQRHRRLAACALCGARRRAGRCAREAPGHHAERHSQGISLARHARVPARTLHAAHQGRDPVHDHARCRGGTRSMCAPTTCRRRVRRRSRSSPSRSRLPSPCSIPSRRRARSKPSAKWSAASRSSSMRGCAS